MASAVPYRPTKFRASQVAEKVLVCEALYQGTSLLVPKVVQNVLGFSPCKVQLVSKETFPQRDNLRFRRSQRASSLVGDPVGIGIDLLRGTQSHAELEVLALGNLG